MPKLPSMNKASTSNTNENQGLFQQYRQHNIYGGNIAILDIIAAIINEQYNQAERIAGYG